MVWCCSVCAAVGLFASYLNRPIYPEAGRDYLLDDKATYNTLIRIGGSFGKIGEVFLRIMEFYGWRRVVILSDVNVGSFCLYGASAIFNVLSVKQDYYVEWIKMSPTPSNSDITGYLQDVQSRSRSKCYSLP